MSFDDIYPVGSIYISISATTTADLPAAFTADGRQWTRIGNGRCLWGVNSNNDNLGKHLDGILPKHTHSFYACESGFANVPEGGADTNRRTTCTTSTGTIDSTVSNVSMGTTLRPPSIGCVFWKRTA